MSYEVVVRPSNGILLFRHRSSDKAIHRYSSSRSDPSRKSLSNVRYSCESAMDRLSSLRKSSREPSPTEVHQRGNRDENVYGDDQAREIDLRGDRAIQRFPDFCQK